MSLLGQLYRLQQLDLELRENLQELNKIANQLSDNEDLVAAESRISAQKEQLEETRKGQKSSEWELEDLQEKIRQIDSKLYGGKTKDPKELVNLEREVKGLRSQVKPKEDALLGLMSQIEEMEAGAKTAAGGLKRLREEWEQRQETLRPRKTELEIVLADLKGERNRLAEQISSENLDIYERIRSAMGQAIVKVERGRCLGCHINVPTSQWQKARAGDLIQCNNCSRILYLE
jgi:predicted  nucleic acid-binding Zn-ribbon protein